LQAQLGVTPDRSRAERQRLAARAAEAQDAADTHAARAQQLAAVLAFEVSEGVSAGWAAVLPCLRCMVALPL
jgi:hypothetical protein